MKVENLSIGNYVVHKGEVCEVVEIRKRTGVIVLKNGTVVDPEKEDVEGYQVTPQSLTTVLGISILDSIEGSTYLLEITPEILLVISPDLGQAHIKNMRTGIILVEAKVKYIHQIQNLINFIL